MQKVVVTQLLFIAKLSKDEHRESSLLCGVKKMYMDVSFSTFAVIEADKTIVFFLNNKMKSCT